MQTQVRELLEKNNYVDALPLLKKLAFALPGDADTHFYLGFSLLAKSVTVEDAAAAAVAR